MYKSKKQKEWANTPEGMKALGKDKIEHLNKISEHSYLPLRVIPSPKKSVKKVKSYKIPKISWKDL